MKEMRVFCDCGELLIYEVDKVVTNIQYNITKSGQLSKRPVRCTDGLGSNGESYNFGRLMCTGKHCQNRYEYDYSHSQRRVIRGDLLD